MNPTLALVAVVAAFGFASPAFAQAFKPDDGGGTVLRAYYGPHRGLHTGKFVPEQAGCHSSEWTARVRPAPSPSGTSSFYRYNPSLTGGGSAGYNFMESQDGSAATLH